MNKQQVFNWASSKGKVNIAVLMIKLGVDVRDDDDFALRCSAFYGHTDIVKLLLDQGVVPSVYALDAASVRGHTDIIKLLEEKCVR